MKRLVLAIAFVLFAVFELAACCPCFWGSSGLSACSSCASLCTSIPTGILLPLVVQSPPPAAPDSALVSTQSVPGEEPPATCSAGNPVPF